MATIPLLGAKAAGRVTHVDDADLPLVQQYRWHVIERIEPNGHQWGPYVVAKAPTGRRGGRTIYMHILIMGGKGIDHIDGDTLNNRRSNLRFATPAQNMVNRGSQDGSTSRFKGVHWDRKRRAWYAQIGVNYHVRNLGRFADEEAAARAYDAEAFAAWGEFARLNFPRG